MTAKHVAYAWLISVLLVPPFYVINWGLGYIFYGSMFVIALLSLIATGAKRKNIPPLLLVQTALLVILATIYLSDTATLLNILDLLFINLMMIMVIYNIPNTFDSFTFIFPRLRWILFALAVYGLIMSTLLAGPLGLDNPVKDFLSGDRVRIFSKHFGHSDLIDIGVLNLIITLSGIKPESILRKASWAISSVIMILVCRSAIGYIGLTFVLAIWLIEQSKIGFKIKNIFYIFAIPALVIAYTFAGDTIITSVRTLQVGARSVGSTYGHNGDLTAGRSELNLYLVKLIQGNQLYGVGVKNRLLTDGIVSQGGQKVAVTESSLRIAAKYGIFYYFVIGLFGVSPFLVLLLKDRRLRILGLCLGAYCLDVFLLNSLFEVAHDWNTLTLMFPVLLIGEFARKGAYRAPQLPMKVAH